MNGNDYADSIRIDKPKTVNEQLRIIHKKRLLIQYLNVPMMGFYLIFNFFIITQYYAITRADPPMLWLDIVTMIALLLHTYIYIRLLSRYIFLEMKYFQNEIQHLEEKNEKNKN